MQKIRGKVTRCPPAGGRSDPGRRRAERLLATITPLYRRVIEKTAKRLGIDPECAAEPVHKVLDELLETATRRARKKPVAQWLHFLVEASVRAYWRSLGRDRIVLLSELTPEEEEEFYERKASRELSPLEAAMKREEERLAWGELTKLSPQQRRVVLLRVGGLAFGEIAEQLRITPGNARFHYHVGVRALRGRLHVAA